MERVIFLEEFGKAFVPKKAFPYLRSYLLKAGIRQTPYRLFGALFYVSFGITLALYFIFINPFLVSLIENSSALAPYSSLALLLFSFGVVFILLLLLSTLIILLVYFYLDLQIFRRTKEMESLLADYLQSVSSNLRGGLTFENALWAAIKPRFKVLGSEMAEVAKKVMTGYPTRRALLELSEKYDSPTLRRSIDLIISEIESGGDVAGLLDRIVSHLKETKNLKEDLAASAISYVIFISVIVVVISPLLFALAYNLLVVLLGFIGNLASATQRVSSLPFSITSGNVNTGDFKIFSIIIVSLISFFASLIVSIVEKGSIKSGVKYIPVFLFGSLGFYFLFLKVLTGLFSGIV